MLSQRKLRTALLGAAALIAVRSGPAFAQSVDYGVLEQLFGEPVTTSVTGKPQRASEVPGDLTIITQDDIQRSGADNIPDILQFVTGIDTRRETFASSQIAIRGYDSPFNPRLLVLVDGRQVYLDDYGYVAWNDIPVQLDEIRQIEIVKGPASALFGFNAASGVINIVTFDPLLDNTNVATARGGTQGYGAGDAVATEHLGKTAGVRISVGGWTATDFPQRGPYVSTPSPRYASVNISAKWQVLPKVLLSVEGGDTDSHTAEASNLGSLTNTQDQLSFFRVGIVADTRAGTAALDFYRNHALLDLGVAGTSPNDVTVLKGSDLLQVNTANTFRFGAEYRNNTINNSQLYGGRIGYDNYSANAMWDWRISPILDLTNAVRVDHLQLHYAGTLAPIPGRTLDLFNGTMLTEPSFNSGLVVKVSDTDTVRLTAARGLQVPSLIDLGVQGGFSGYYYLGSPTDQATAIWNTELSYDRPVPMLGATLSSSVFWQRNTGLLAGAGNAPFVAANGLEESSSQNIGSSNELGFEFGLRGKMQNGFRWNASYRYASITQDLTHLIETFPTTGTSPDNGTPLHAVVLGGGYTVGKWELDGQGRWQSAFTDYTVGHPTDTPLRIGGYVTFNARVGYKINRYLTIAGTAEQFNMARLTQSAGDYVDRRFFASATTHF